MNNEELLIHSALSAWRLYETGLFANSMLSARQSCRGK